MISGLMPLVVRTCKFRKPRFCLEHNRTIVFPRLDHVVNIVREGQTKRAPIERVADMVTAYFVPVITLFAISTWVIWLSLGLSGALPERYLDVDVGGWRECHVCPRVYSTHPCCSRLVVAIRHCGLRCRMSMWYWACRTDGSTRRFWSCRKVRHPRARRRRGFPRGAFRQPILRTSVKLTHELSDCAVGPSRFR